MKEATHFTVHPAWKMILIDVGVKPAEVLAHAKLPGDLFSRKDALLSVS